VPFVICCAKHGTAPTVKAAIVAPIMLLCKTASILRAVSIARLAIVSFWLKHRALLMS
jgi:hypothetical protein